MAKASDTGSADRGADKGGAGSDRGHAPGKPGELGSIPSGTTPLGKAAPDGATIPDAGTTPGKPGALTGDQTGPGGRLDPLNASGSEPPVNTPGRTAAGATGATGGKPVGGPEQSGPRSGESGKAQTARDRQGPRGSMAPGVMARSSFGGEDVTVNELVDKFRSVVDHFESRDFWGALRAAGDLLRTGADAFEQQFHPMVGGMAHQQFGEEHQTAVKDFDRECQRWDKCKAECTQLAPQLTGVHGQDWQRQGRQSGSPAPLGSAPNAVGLSPSNLMTLLQLVSDVAAMLKKLFGRE